jgi:adenylosuccinate synthase
MTSKIIIIFNNIIMKAITKKVMNASQCKDGLKSNFCVVLGLQWGHEGKDKLLNKLCPAYDYSCRFNGGVFTEKNELDNEDELFVLPNGIKHDTKVKSLLGNGVVIDPQAMLSDFSTLSKNGIGFKDRLIISDRCNIVTGIHKEIAKKIKKIREDDVWLSGQDISQAFKPMKMGLRVCHLIEDWDAFQEKYLRIRKTCQELYRVEFD